MAAGRGRSLLATLERRLGQLGCRVARPTGTARLIRTDYAHDPQGSSTSAAQQLYSLANGAAAIGQIQHAPLLFSRQNLHDTHVLQGQSNPIRGARILFIEGRPAAHR